MEEGAGSPLFYRLHLSPSANVDQNTEVGWITTARNLDQNGWFGVDRNIQSRWISTVNLGQSPLNINLIISFKDNKRGWRSRLDREIEAHMILIEERVQEIKEEMIPIFGPDFEIGIFARANRAARSFTWRYRATSKNRKHARLCDPSFSEVWSRLHHDQRIVLRSIEQELLALNANLSILGAIKNASSEYDDSVEDLRNL